MKILFVSNYYPPHYIGGYELLCARAAEFLAAQGHEVRILTSNFGCDSSTPLTRDNTGKVKVFRELELRYWRDIYDARYWLREWRDIRIFLHREREFKPDIIGLWNMHKLAYGIVMLAQRLTEKRGFWAWHAQRTSKLVYHLMDDWILQFRDWNGLPQFWAKKPQGAIGKVLKPLLRIIYTLIFDNDLAGWKPRNAVVVSKALRKRVEDADLGFQSIFVGPSTFDPALFYPSKKSAGENGPIRFLWSGRICREKGFSTTLKALDLLAGEMGEELDANFRITFCGNVDNGLADRFETLLVGKRWSHLARYLGSLPHEQMPEVYRAHDVFLFTSEVHEGLPSSIVEAFGSGLTVIGTLTGGTSDLLFDGENCLVYNMGDPHGLTDAMKKLIANRGLSVDLSSGVADFARRNYSNQAIFSGMEEFYAHPAG